MLCKENSNISVMDGLCIGDITVIVDRIVGNGTIVDKAIGSCKRFVGTGQDFIIGREKFMHGHSTRGTIGSTLTGKWTMWCLC